MPWDLQDLDSYKRITNNTCTHPVWNKVAYVRLSNWYCIYIYLNTISIITLWALDWSTRASRMIINISWKSFAFSFNLHTVAQSFCSKVTKLLPRSQDRALSTTCCGGRTKSYDGSNAMRQNLVDNCCDSLIKISKLWKLFSSCLVMFVRAWFLTLIALRHLRQTWQIFWLGLYGTLVAYVMGLTERLFNIQMHVTSESDCKFQSRWTIVSLDWMTCKNRKVSQVNHRWCRICKW